MRNGFKRGFTLIELAIVILVVSLLTGGLVMGFEMVRAAETRAIISESDRFITGIKAFRDKYNQIPGDFNRAETMWGSDATGGGCTGNSFSSAPKRETCNGNGDGTIGDCCPVGNTYEWYRAWQHLANAGLVDGAFSGIGGFESPATLRGASVPASVFPGGAYTLMFTVSVAVTAESFIYDAGHYLQIGQIPAACDTSSDMADCISNGPLFKPAEALDIDTKIDDGMPGSGRVLSRPSTSTLNPDCTTTNVALTSAYRITNTQQACALLFNTGY